MGKTIAVPIAAAAAGDSWGGAGGSGGFADGKGQAAKATQVKMTASAIDRTMQAGEDASIVRKSERDDRHDGEADQQQGHGALRLGLCEAGKGDEYDERDDPEEKLGCLAEEGREQ